MSINFSSNNQKIIIKRNDANISHLSKFLPDEYFIELYEIEDCLEWIQKFKFKKIGLQFSENLFEISCQIFRIFQDHSTSLDIEFAILAEQKYGSCCIDEITAEHFEADAVVHFGHSCLSFNSKLPVKLVFGKEEIDIVYFAENCLNKINKNNSLLLIYNVLYHHNIVLLKQILKDDNFSFVCPELENHLNKNQNFIKQVNCFNTKCCVSNEVNIKLNLIFETSNLILSKTDSTDCKNTFLSNDNYDENKSKLKIKSNFTKFGRNFNLLPNTYIEDYTIFYIGSETDALFKELLLSFSSNKFLNYDPKNKELKVDSFNATKLLKRRYYMIEKARDAKFVGILIGTLEVKDHILIIGKLIKVLKQAGKKYRIYSPGSINVAKLANVPEFDLFVLVACHENTLIDSSDFLCSVVTPFEMLAACDISFQWTGNYDIEFSTLLNDTYFNEPEQLNEKGKDNIQHEVSLITGKIRQIGCYQQSQVVENTDILMKRNENNSLIQSSDILHSRSWYGLEPELGKTPVNKAAPGTSGIPSSYSHETQF